MYPGYPLPKLDPTVTRTSVFGLSADTKFCRLTSRFNVRDGHRQR